MKPPRNIKTLIDSDPRVPCDRGAREVHVSPVKSSLLSEHVARHLRQGAGKTAAGEATIRQWFPRNAIPE